MSETRVLEIRPEETFISYDLPLKPECKRVLDLLQERYTDAEGNALKPKYTDSLVILHIPRTLKLKVGRAEVEGLEEGDAGYDVSIIKEEKAS